MMWRFNLADYDTVKTNATMIYGRLTGTTGTQMPPPPMPPLDASLIALYKQWMSGMPSVTGVVDTQASFSRAEDSAPEAHRTLAGGKRVSARPPDLGWFYFSSPGGASELTTSTAFSDSPTPLRGSEMITHLFRWLRANRACHRLISDAPPARDHRNFQHPRLSDHAVLVSPRPDAYLSSRWLCLLTRAARPATRRRA